MVKFTEPLAEWVAVWVTFIKTLLYNPQHQLIALAHGALVLQT
jgi:hypothetical protein